MADFIDDDPADADDARLRSLRARRQAMRRVNDRRSRQWALIITIVSAALTVQAGTLALRRDFGEGRLSWIPLAVGSAAVAVVAFRTWRRLNAARPDDKP